MRTSRPGAQLTGITGDEPISDSSLLVHPSRAITQREAEHAEAEAACAAVAAVAAANATGAGAAGTDVDGQLVTVPGGSTTSGTTPALKNTRFYGTVRLDPERFGRDLNRLCQEVIQHLAAPEGVDLRSRSKSARSRRTASPTPRPASSRRAPSP